MTITVAEHKIKPATEELILNRLHVEKLIFLQEKENVPDIRIEMICYRYGFDSDGNKVYDDIPLRGVTPDFNSVAIAEAMNNGSTLEQAMTDYAAAKKEVNDKHAVTPYSTFELMARFELTLGMLIEKLGLTTLEKIE